MSFNHMRIFKLNWERTERQKDNNNFMTYLFYLVGDNSHNEKTTERTEKHFICFPFSPLYLFKYLTRKHLFNNLTFASQF